MVELGRFAETVQEENNFGNFFNTMLSLEKEAEVLGNVITGENLKTYSGNA
jgi:hypothetical protein